MVDFILKDEGSIFLLEPLTDAAREWVAAHLEGADVQHWCGSVVIEQRYVSDIVQGLQADGLTML